MPSNYIDIMKERENSIKDGWNRVEKKWYPHPSGEGGFDTLAYGHKLDKSGMITIGGKKYKAYDGITDALASKLLTQDFTIARKSALNSARKGGLDHIGGLVDATASLIMNVKPKSWGRYKNGKYYKKKSKALKALERGDHDKFFIEAFTGEYAFNKKKQP